MSDIITTTQVQQKIGQISSTIEEKNYIVTKNGKGKIVMLPYFDGCDEQIADYLEEFEIQKNKEFLEKELKKSKKSGKSSLII